MDSDRNSDFMEFVLDAIEYIALALEVMAVIVIVAGVVFAIATVMRKRTSRLTGLFDPGDTYDQFRIRIGNTLLLGLEILVAADVVRTVALEPTVENAAILGLLVLIRTFLSWSLTVEIEHRWPWQSERSEV